MRKWAIVCVMTPRQAEREGRTSPCYFAKKAPEYEPHLFDSYEVAKAKADQLTAYYSTTNYFVVEYEDE